MAKAPHLADVHTAITNLQQLTELFQKRRAQLAAAVGLTEHQWGVLEEISTEHFMPSLFAKQQQSSPAAVSKTIRQLVDKGLVSVKLGQPDARHRRYELTRDGQRVMTELRAKRELAVERVWMGLDAAAIRSFNGLAETLAQGLQDLLETA